MWKGWVILLLCLGRSRDYGGILSVLLMPSSKGLAPMMSGRRTETPPNPVLSWPALRRQLLPS